MDKMKMGGWQETSEWGKSRGPDALLEFFDFCTNAVTSIQKKQPSHPICVTLLDQAYFNGIGNYLRAEILNRAGLDPFQPTMNVFGATPKNFNLQTFASIMKEATADPREVPALKKTLKHDPGLMVLYLARQIQMEVLAGGMNKYGSPDEQAKFHKWLHVYGKGTEVKAAGRSVHCTPEQRLGKQERDLGTFINKYPCELSGLYYKNPTITISADAAASSSSSGVTSSTDTAAAALPSTPPSGSGGTFNVKRIDENILTCSEIADLPVPMTSKLLLTITSLSRSGKLNFVDEASIRETVLDEHPVAFSAWQVFEANGDEDDFVDTLKRLAIATAPMRKEREAQAAYLSAHLAAIAIAEKQQQTSSFGSGSGGGGTLVGTSASLKKAPPVSAAPQHFLAKKDHDEPISAGKGTKAAKRERFSEERSSSSTASSVDGDSASSLEDHDLEMSPPKKKKVPASSHAYGLGKMEKKKPLKSKFEPPSNLKSGGTGAFGKRIVASSSSSPSSSSSGALDFSVLGDIWLNHLSSYIKSSKQLTQLSNFLASAYVRNDPPIYPPQQDIFNAFKLCPLNKVKVVILGQDPYHGPGQAHGLCFSVLRPVPPPPSLVNIFKELESDISSFKAPNHGDLTSWANQGVFLLNTVLTVFQQKPNSHANMGWEGFTDFVIKTIM